MESFEASRAAFSRVQIIDPENASKIMGYILLHHGEKDMVHLAYGPETLIVSLISRAKTDLGLSSNTSSATLPSPISNPIAISRPNPLSLSSPRLLPSSPSSPSIWSPHHRSLSPSNSLSYASAVANSNSNGGFSRENSGFLDDCHLQDANLPPFLDTPLILPNKNVDFSEQQIDLAMSPGCRSDSMLHPYWDNSPSATAAAETAHFSRRSSSFNDNLFYGTDDSTSGFGFKPCSYYARGFCKNGSSCKFVHGGGGGGCNGGVNDDNCGHIVGSPCSYDAFEQCQEEIIRSKLAQQHRLAQLMASGGVTLPFNKLNFLNHEAQRSAAALMIGEEFHKLNRVRMARNDFSGMDINPGSRQIYLTFPADSTFKEEDVSSYFNRYGPVQDVRIPYQQKRMFGFVTFVYPETVKIILAKGNPHFVCESRVLVKPYKEKGKLPDKKHNNQQLERGEFSCSSPSGHDCREPYDFQLGGRMMYSSTQEMLLRKKLEEQADYQHALEAQERRLMNLQLLDLKNQQNHRTAPVGSPVLSPDLSQSAINQAAPLSSCGINVDVTEEVKGSPAGSSDEERAEGDNVAMGDSNGNVQKKEENDLFDSLENALPDNLFASPKKQASDIRPAAFSPALGELDNGAARTVSSLSEDSSLPVTSSIAMTPLKSCFFEMSRISTGHGALGM